MRGEFIDVGGSRLYCYAFGSRGAGEPIVLVHGAFTSSHLWQDTLPRLPRGHRVLVVDLLGHGRSDPARRAPMTIAAHTERLMVLADTLRVGVATFVGHGMGAAIVTRLAGLEPHRVARLGLVNPTMMASVAAHATINRRVRRVSMFGAVWRRLAPGWLASVLHSALLPAYAQRTMGRHSLDVYLKSFLNRDGRDSALAQLEAFGHSRSDTCDALQPGALACPVALVLGEQDPWLRPSRAARVIDDVSGACAGDCTVHTLPGVAHVAPEEAPDTLGNTIAALVSRAPQLTEPPLAVARDADPRTPGLHHLME